MKQRHTPQLISFDAGFTLIYPYPKVGDAYAAIASRFGYDLDGAEIHRRFLSAWKRNVDANRRNNSSNALTSEAGALAWWKEIFNESLRDLIKCEDMEPVFHSCYEEYAFGTYWRAYDDVLPVLQTLRRRGIELVVLSNWDHRLHRTLADLDLAKYFKGIYISTEIGFAKPQSGAFHHILNGRDLQGKDILHIGDSLDDDYHGARAAGIGAIHLDRDRLESDFHGDIPTIHTLTELTDSWLA